MTAQIPMPKARNDDRHTPRRASGFTLIELLITISVAGLLLAIAVPSFNDLIVGNKLTTQTNAMIAAINIARSEAIKRNRSISLCRAEQADSADCAAASGNWGHWMVRTNTGTVVQRGVVNNYAGTLVVQSTLTADQVVFGSDGLARTNNVLVTNQTLRVCATNSAADNIRQVTLGRGSRLSTATLTGGC